jgi:hypothetical protein
MKKVIMALAMAGVLSMTAMAADVTGTIIDQNCASKPAMKGDIACATKCIKGGSPAVLLTDDGKVYKIANQQKIVEHAGHKVTVTGKMEGDTITVDSVKMT